MVIERANGTFTKIEKKQLLIFVLVTFGTAFLMGIPLAFIEGAGKETSAFAYAQMFYPAAGFMLAKLICEKDNSLLPKKFFGGFLLLTIVMILWCFVGFFVSSETSLFGCTLLLGVGSILIAFLLIIEKDETRDAYKLNGGSWKVSFGVLILFLVLFFARDFILDSATGFELFGNASPSQLLITLMQVPMFFIFTFAAFFGEEYGWRCYFQPLLQQKFGLIKGVLIFGVLWGLWHFQLDLFYYPSLDLFESAGTTPILHTVLIRQVTCISLGIFFAYAYMKTNNLWLPVLLHIIHNSLATIMKSCPELFNQAYTLTMVGLWALVNFMLFVPFLWSKVFRRQVPPKNNESKVYLQK